MSVLINAIDRIFSWEKNTVRRDAVWIASEVREFPPVGALVLFLLGWLAGMIGSWVVLAVVGALVTGLLLARAAVIPTPTVASVPTAIESPIVQSLPLNELLSQVGLHIKKIEIAPQAVKKTA
jgi:hypothetical protein